jgi:hypothetical protein
VVYDNVLPTLLQNPGVLVLKPLRALGLPLHKASIGCFYQSPNMEFYEDHLKPYFLEIISPYGVFLEMGDP